MLEEQSKISGDGSLIRFFSLCFFLLYIVSILRNGAIRGNRIEPTVDILREMMAAMIYFNLNDNDNFNFLRGWRGWLR